MYLVFRQRIVQRKVWVAFPGKEGEIKGVTDELEDLQLYEELPNHLETYKFVWSTQKDIYRFIMMFE